MLSVIHQMNASYGSVGDFTHKVCIQVSTGAHAKKVVSLRRERKVFKFTHEAVLFGAEHHRPNSEKMRNKLGVWH